MEPVEFIEKLSALVPPPRSHLVHYSGVLAPNSKWRRQKKDEEERKGPERADGGKKRRRDWAELLQKTFGIDALACAKCGGRMKLIAMIKKASTIRKILQAMGYGVDRIEAASEAIVPRSGVDPPEGDSEYSEPESQV